MIFFRSSDVDISRFSTYPIQNGPKMEQKKLQIEDFDGKSRKLRSLRLFFQTLEQLMVLVLPVKS